MIPKMAFPYTKVIFRLFVIFLFLIKDVYALNGWTCQGKTYQEALDDYNCVDEGAQRVSSGGMVSIILDKATNLKNTDYSGPSSGVSDPHVIVKYGNDHILVESKEYKSPDPVESTVIRNNLNPEWNNERLQLGVLRSGTELTIEIVDKDIGLEWYYPDRTLNKFKMRVPYCSIFATNYLTDDEVICGDPDGGQRGQPFGCESHDSTWKMPNRKICVEEGWIDMVEAETTPPDSFMPRKCDPNNILEFSQCIRFRIEIVPYQAQIEKVVSHFSNGALYTPSLSTSPSDHVVSVASDSRFGNFFEANGPHPWTTEFGPVFQASEGNDYKLDFNFCHDPDLQVSSPTWCGFEGAMVVRMRPSERNMGLPDHAIGYVSVNLPSDMYICGYIDDRPPNWVIEQYSSKYLDSRRRLTLGSGDEYVCYYKELTHGTQKNKWGGIESGEITLYTRTLYDPDPAGESLLDTSERHYIVLLVPKQIIEPEENIVIIYTREAFITSFAIFGFFFCWILWLVSRFLKKIEYRLDRVAPWLASRVTTGEEDSVLGLLFISYDETPCNVEFRAHLYYAQFIMYFFLFMPSILLIGWGHNLASVRVTSLGGNVIGSPKGLGYAIAWVGNFLLFAMYSMRAWETGQWRMNLNIALSFFISFVCFFVFLVAIIYVDVAHTDYGYSIDFTALSLLFGSLNCMPLILLVFKQDKTYTRDTLGVFKKMSDAVYDQKEAEGRKLKRKKTPMAANKSMHALLGDAYTLNPKCFAFKFASAIKDIKKSTAMSLEQESHAAESHKSASGKSDDSSEDDQVQRGDPLYYWASLILFLYIIFSAVNTNHGNLAVLNVMVLILFDTIHTSLSHGDVVWSPSFKIGLLVLGRFLIMGGRPERFLLTYSAAYCIYSIFLVYEVINIFLPLLSKHEAGVAAYSMEGFDKIAHPDIGSTPHFCFGLLTFCFISLLLICAYGSTDLPLHDIEVYGQLWAVYAFGLIAVVLIVSGGLLMATIRAFQLKGLGLLRGWTKEGYFMRKSFDIPFLLAVGTEIAIVCSGLLIYASTGSAAILILSIYVPPMIACFGYTYKCWVANDYDLVIWPPVDEETVGAVSPSDMEVAFHMIDNLFGTQEDKPIPLIAAIAEEDENKDASENPESDSPKGEKSIGGNKPGSPTSKSFQLPTLDQGKSLKKSDIKMPPLPLKSVLRRKRTDKNETKTKISVEDALHNAKATDAELKAKVEVLSQDDPWLKYEPELIIDTSDANQDNNEASNNQEDGKLPDKPMDQRRIGFANHPYILNTIASLEKSRAGRELLRVMRQCSNGMKIVAERYRKTSPEDEEEEEEEDYYYDSDDEEAGKGKGKDNGGPMSENLENMPFWYAFFFGYLITPEYIALFSFFAGMLLVLFMGVTFKAYVFPSSLGTLIWCGVWMAIFTVVPIWRYFKTFALDETLYTFLGCAITFHFLFCIGFLLGEIPEDEQISTPAALWLLDYFFYFPMLVYLVVEFIKWVEHGFVIERLDKDGDGDVSLMETIDYFGAYPLIFCALIIFAWQLSIWVSATAFALVMMILVMSGLSYIFVRDWAQNDFYLSPEYIFAGNVITYFVLFITMTVAVFNPGNPVISLSVFFLVLLFRQGMKLISRYMVTAADEVIYFSPYLMPVYTYNPRINDLIDESEHAKDLVDTLLVGVLWGAMLAVFLYPVYNGISVCCFFLLFVAVVVSAAMTYVPFSLGRFHSLLTTENILESASEASQRFFERRTPIKLEATHFYGEEVDNWDAKPKTALERMKEEKAINVASEFIEEVRGLSYVMNDDTGVQDVGDVVVKRPNYFQRLWARTYGFIKDMYQSALQLKDWRKHNHALFSFSDSIVYAIVVGKGPWGFLGLGGLITWTLRKMKEEPRLQWAFKFVAWLEEYDEYGNSPAYADVESVQTLTVLGRMADIERALDHCFKEEMRCAVHFLLLMLVAADAKLIREQVLFQKFLRENRFRLASNGISPPAEVFSSNSYASVDIPLVAVWLSSLTSEERDRFQLLKGTFQQEQAERDRAIDTEDYMFSMDSLNLLTERRTKEREMFDQLQVQLKDKQRKRVDIFQSRLPPSDQLKFETKKKEWVSNSDCKVEAEFKDLYDRFRMSIFGAEDEATAYAQQVISEIELQQTNCRAGEYGRQFQYQDPDFGAAQGGVSGCVNSIKVKDWVCAPGISDVSVLFQDGTDPDDVHAGIFNDEWLLSAISMVAAAGDPGEVNDQVINLFVGHKDGEGNVSYNSDVGVFCVRLFKFGCWNPMILDDLFPILQETLWTNENRGMAGAHTKEASEMWVSLIEKAFAKYYGGYKELERGFVHHALADMTGCESECVMLAHASRGAGKRALWDRLVRYRADGYILGAGTGSSALADKEILDMGIIFEAAYTIYDVKKVDGKQLLKLRNPPGDHDEWKGDWSDKSELWTRRLKYKLGWVDEDDNTFWMSFDDFCNVFRQLYVCKWYNPHKWSTKVIPGEWRQSIAYVPDPDQEKGVVEMRSKELTIQGVDVTDGQSDAPPKFINTSGGLPTKHNPGCILENNPHYSLRVFRPVDVRITLSQADTRGMSTTDALPSAIYLCKPPNPDVPYARLKNLDRDNLVAYTGEPIDERTQHLYASLRPGLYIIIPAIYKAGMEGNYTLTVMSNGRTKFQSIWPPRWMTAGGDGDDDLGDLDISKAFQLMSAQVKQLRPNTNDEEGDIEMGKSIGKIKDKP